jgi:hypothetical protein
LEQTVLQPPQQKNRYFLKAFLLGAGVSFLFFLPFIIYDRGYFLYYGDFNVQQVPFYQMIHDAIREGNFFWSWTTDLGANTIGSYSFYLLGSPFFWLTLPFPSAAVPYLMGPLLILKFGCASLTGYFYLRRYAKNQNIALIGGMLYALSGFSVYNIFFNHFHEAIVIFPVLLWAVDEYMYHKRRGVFAATVFFSCLFNYYFFVGQVVFVILYWFVRMFAGSWKITLREFFWMLFEAVLGVLGTAVLLFPTVLCVIQNPRVDSPSNGWGALLYGWEQRYLHILECFFFPPDIPARPNFTPDSEAKWASLGAWLPLFSMSGVIAWFQTKRRHWLKTLLLILFFMAMVPILNSAFQLFNSAYYARWFYMLTLMMSLATVFSLQNAKVDWKRAVKWTLGITLAIALPIGFLQKTTGSGDEKKTQTGLMNYPDRFWIYVAIALLSLLLLVFLLRYLKRDKQRFCRLAMCGIGVVTVIYSAYCIGLGKAASYDTHNFIIPYSLNQGKDIDLPDTENCRIDVFNGMDNQAMFWQIPTIQAFHSIVPGSIMEFYPTIGVTRDVGSRPDTSVYGLRGLTSCRWLFDYANDNKSFMGEDTVTPEMPGWSYYATQNGFDIYQNEYYIPFGFTYDGYITREDYDNVAQAQRHLLLLKALVLEEDGVERNADILQRLDTMTMTYTQNAYYEDCLARKAECCSSFTRDNGGFTAEITVEGKQDRLVFFSVPYEKGWSATVNGQEAVIEKANVGFMAVRVPGGSTSTIRFEYRTPGLMPGLIVTLVCIAIFVVYLYFFRQRSKGEPTPARVTYHVAQGLPQPRQLTLEELVSPEDQEHPGEPEKEGTSADETGE